MQLNRTALLGLCLVLPAVAEGAGFDCTKATAKVEKLVCADVELSELDSKLAARYERALKESPFDAGTNAIRNQQRQWLRVVRNVCPDVGCLRAAYSRRLTSFEWTTRQGKNVPICEELRGHYNRSRVSLTSYAMEEKETGQDEPNFSIPDINVDGDKTNDQVLLFRTGSASLIPPDNSSLSLVLSSTGEKFTIEAQRLYVIRYKSSHYVLTSDWLGEAGPVRSDVYALERRGIRKLCSYECGLGSQCGN